LVGGSLPWSELSSKVNKRSLNQGKNGINLKA
jgi:hypothetical protein